MPKLGEERISSKSKMDDLNSPLISEVGVVSLVPDEWSGPWHSRHHILSRLSRYFHIVWVNPARDLAHAFSKRRTDNKKCLDRYPGLTVYDPWLPVVYRSQLLGDFTFRQRLKHASELLTKKGVRKQVLYIWRPIFAKALELTDFDVSCYHIDDEYSFSPIEVPIHDAEAQLLKKVNQVFIHSPGLMERKGQFNPNTLMVPNGVDFQLYSRIQDEPEELANIPRPRIGYTGWMKKHLDWTLLQDLTARHPDWSFVLVGPASPQADVHELIEQLKRRRNVYFIGEQPAERLPGFVRHFDVCIMPYAVNDYTKYIYPLKLHEYLATGRPTIGAHVRSIESFSEVVSLADTSNEWSAAIAKALLPEANTPEKIRVRQALAREHDWDGLVSRIARTIVGRLGTEYVYKYFMLLWTVASLISNFDALTTFSA
jgi:glycosyltransferase involved in cell wall biosynthesis